jgi:arginine utilization protein RocB
MLTNDFLADRTEHWARLLTAIPSVTGSADEAAFAPRLAELLRRSPAFDGRPDAVWTVPVPGGAHGRACVLGLLRGAGRRTVVLTGHFDIVETSCYGDLEPLALDPDRLAPALIERIAAEPHDPKSAKAVADLASGAFMPGRGLLDMKAGLAAGLAVIEAAAGSAGLAGNLLFIGVPDEEGNSAGARHMAGLLSGIAADRQLDIEAVINLDAIGDEGDGTLGRVVALGSVGKLLPSALVVGRPAHAVDTFRGFSAAALAGALAASLEWSPELTERSGDELGAGPTLLGTKDSKAAYDVTMPASVWMYWNVMTHRRSPSEVLDRVAEAARQAGIGLSAMLQERATASGASVEFADVAILRFETLLAEIASTGLRHRVDQAAAELVSGGIDMPEQCRRVTELAWQLSGRTGPAIVLGFASIPYLPVTLGDDAGARRLRQAVVDAAASVSRAFATSIGTIRYFPGISDVSFFGEADDRHVQAIAANTPAWPSVLAGAERFGAAGLPAINVGPWGRDYHTRLERMHIDYGFRIVPALVQEIVGRIFASE